MSYQHRNYGGGHQGGQRHQGGRQNRGHQDRNNSLFDDNAKKHITTIIENGFTESSMKFIESVGEGIKGVTSSQIRIAYGEVTRLKMKAELNIGEVLMLKPKLAYAAGRATQNKQQYQDLKDIVSYAVDLATSETLESKEQNKRFKHLASMFEAILAYHKANGGK